MRRAPADGDFSFVCRDGIPPYRIGSKKQLQREMHRSVKANGQVSLPHFPVSSGGSCKDLGWLWEMLGLGMGMCGEKGAGEESRAFPSPHDAREEMPLGRSHMLPASLQKSAYDQLHFNLSPETRC